MSTTSSSTLFGLLDGWVASGALRSLDRAFARFLLQHDAQAGEPALLAAVFASHQLGRGHACLDLRAALHDPAGTLAFGQDDADSADEAADTSPAAALAGIDLARWIAAIDAARFVDGDGPGGQAPLVRSGERLYLRRYWQYEQSVRQAIDSRVATPSAAARSQAHAGFVQALEALFPREPGAPANWQKMACALVARQGFGIVTGGPGTGKTTTVVRLLALLQYLALSGDGQRLRIRLAAPTGKAAARLGESISGAVSRLALQDLPGAAGVREAIPTAVTTVHRLLGSKPDSRQFRHDAQNPLPLDVLVLDEASMLDLEMFAAVLAALPAHAQLLLLGDKDQLASVEAGSVLGDLCQRADAGHYLPATAAWLADITGEQVDPALIDPHGHALDQAVAKLRVSYRFHENSGIGRLADAANRGDVSAVRQALSHGYADLAFQADTGDAALRRLVTHGAAQAFRGTDDTNHPAGYSHYLALVRDGRPPADAPRDDFDRWAAEVLRRYGEFQLLCAVRAGPLGVEAVNERIARLLRAGGWLDTAAGDWYSGRPVMVTRNDHALGLMNGDVGITLALPLQAPDGALVWVPRVAFAAPGSPGGIRWVMPSRLTEVETVFAMTVHKSQGSEFTHAALLLPAQPSRVLTRELVYTGVTRAKRWFTLVASPQMLEAAVLQRIERASGLAAEQSGASMD
ncbi:exodeoxyribonuclease V subunit alpha [Xylophilus rhododendri]|uniref:RecBCD enzyme subunit RecD n=1 Tax=Xylophilus rhododendri TaxID=2697032 RepID=A0A857J1S6_9BURK|nr:exodeoxyribonuclease V subunit alpha [Xylophilus rhododendri]QHI97193.1 exodeoxyribonuclease V subunit alpha [Xylophilus rhododendri]